MSCGEAKAGAGRPQQVEGVLISPADRHANCNPTKPLRSVEIAAAVKVPLDDSHTVFGTSRKKRKSQLKPRVRHKGIRTAGMGGK